MPFNEDSSHLTIHECWIRSKGLSSEESFRINVEACRRSKEVPVWNFDYEWHLRFETGTGRSPLGLAVQLGAWLLAMRRFRFIQGLDRDSAIKNEPTEFRSRDAAICHVRRLVEEKVEVAAELRRRKLLDENGFLLLPSHSVPEATTNENDSQ